MDKALLQTLAVYAGKIADTNVSNIEKVIFISKIRKYLSTPLIGLIYFSLLLAVSVYLFMNLNFLLELPYIAIGAAVVQYGLGFILIIIFWINAENNEYESYTIVSLLSLTFIIGLWRIFNLSINPPDTYILIRVFADIFTLLVSIIFLFLYIKEIMKWQLHYRLESKYKCMMIIEQTNGICEIGQFITSNDKNDIILRTANGVEVLIKSSYIGKITIT